MVALFKYFMLSIVLISMSSLMIISSECFLKCEILYPPTHQMYMLWFNINNFLNNEMKISLNKNINFYNMLIFKTLFIFIMLSNFISLFPYIFNNTSHVSLSLMLSMMLWISFMIFGWIKNSSHMYVHLTPQGTPYPLMPFMVLIETVSNLIRPITLSVRLSANIIAGHLLMTLISSSMIKMSMMMILMMIIIQSSLVILEVAVSFIQSYVFTILSSLYSSETN
uniref:ATP synthase subunit a n=1 Tax=Synergus sp. 1 DYB-20230501 TaxID=3136278 RepID=A0AAU6QD63_9HYME